LGQLFVSVFICYTRGGNQRFGHVTSFDRLLTKDGALAMPFLPTTIAGEIEHAFTIRLGQQKFE
jgi:hypothetical protein